MAAPNGIVGRYPTLSEVSPRKRLLRCDRQIARSPTGRSSAQGVEGSCVMPDRPMVVANIMSLRSGAEMGLRKAGNLPRSLEPGYSGGPRIIFLIDTGKYCLHDDACTRDGCLLYPLRGSRPRAVTRVDVGTVRSSSMKPDRSSAWRAQLCDRDECGNP